MKFTALTLSALVSFSGLAQVNLEEVSRYTKSVNKVSKIYGDQKVRSLAKTYGLDVLNVTWEDTARYQNSSVR